MLIKVLQCLNRKTLWDVKTEEIVLLKYCLSAIPAMLCSKGLLFHCKKIKDKNLF